MAEVEKMSSHWLYVVHFKDFVKIGETKQMNKRLSGLACQFKNYEVDIEASFAWRIPVSVARALEGLLIKKHQDLTVPIEGSTETFSVDAVELFKSDVQKFFDLFNLKYYPHSMSEFFVAKYRPMQDPVIHRNRDYLKKGAER